ncbi:MAG: formylglycine-generating enzyme family protein [Magnetococcales bacterium]|nr:formylglycine-generating enzyme family protein [Magnetococcales bacterium]
MVTFFKNFSGLIKLKSEPLQYKIVLFLLLFAAITVTTPYSFAEIDSYTTPKEFKNSIGMKFVLIPSGRSVIGSPDGGGDSRRDETPQHMVSFDKPFYLGKYEVTQQQYKLVMNRNISKFKLFGETRPVENVSWYDAQKFIKKLNELEGENKYRLPTESEWEYACRAGTKTDYSFGDDEADIAQYAWYGDNKGNANGRTHDIGSKKPNPWGLYDMHGNVLEWVQDVYKRTAYRGEEHRGKNHLYEGSGSFRILRGGSWIHDAEDLRCANRNFNLPGNIYHNTGFRILKEL